MGKNKFLRYFFTVLFAAIFLYGAANLFAIWYEYHEASKLYNQAQEEFLGEVELPQEEMPLNGPQFQVDFDSLHGINTDIVGWIWQKDTVINYPVLQSKKNNDEYIYTTYDRKHNNAGSIFMDYRNYGDYTDDNTILYGHNMKNGKMFAGLKKLQNQEYYDSHSEFYILTPEGNRRYEIISVFQVDALSSIYDRQFASVEDKQKWLNRVLKSSAILSPFTVSVDDTFVTLSTCVSGDDYRARIVAIGRFAELEAPYQPQETESIPDTMEE